MIAKVNIKSSSGTVTHDMMREAWCTSSKIEASYDLHANYLLKAGIPENNTSYDKTVKGTTKITFSHHLNLICLKDAHFQLTQKGTGTNKCLSVLCVHRRVKHVRYCQVSMSATVLMLLAASPQGSHYNLFSSSRDQWQ